MSDRQAINTWWQAAHVVNRQRRRAARPRWCRGFSSTRCRTLTRTWSLRTPAAGTRWCSHTARAALRCRKSPARSSCSGPAQARTSGSTRTRRASTSSLSSVRPSARFGFGRGGFISAAGWSWWWWWWPRGWRGQRACRLGPAVWSASVRSRSPPLFTAQLSAWRRQGRRCWCCEGAGPVHNVLLLLVSFSA